MSVLAEKWRELGRAIEQSADNLEALCSGNMEDEMFFEHFSSKLDFLERYDFIVGNQASGYMPSPLLIDIASTLSLSAVRQHVAPDLEYWFNQIEKSVSLLNSSQEQGKLLKYQQELKNINILCWSMLSGLKEEIKDIDYLIQTKFGHVSSLKDKQIENESYIQRVVLYAKKVTHLNVSVFLKLSHNNSDLNRIFFVKFMPEIENCRERFKSALPQLERLLWSYRQHDFYTQRVWAISRHLSQGGHILQEMMNDNELFYSPFNFCESQAINAYPGINELENNTDLINIVKSLPTKMDSIFFENNDIEQSELDNQDIIYDQEEEIFIEDSILDEHLLVFIDLSLSSGISALNYWKKNGIKDIPNNIWLLWSHQELENYDDLLLTISPSLDDLKSYVGNILVEDYTVRILH
jgi:hypothetical protein